MYILGLKDLNNLRASQTDENEDESDPFCKEVENEDPYFVEEIAITKRDLEEMEKLSDQCGVHISTTTRLPCVAHKASNNLLS